MSVLTRPLDPRLLEIIGDLEKRDVASLFVRSPTRLVKGLRDGSAHLRTGAIGHSAALKELLRVRREEFAYALFAKGRSLLLKADQGPWTIIDSSYKLAESSDAPSECHPVDFWGQGSHEEALKEGWFGELMDELPVEVENMAANSLFEASLRVAPRETARINWALALARSNIASLADRIALAEGLLTDVERSTASEEHALCAGRNLGFVAWLGGDLQAARDHYEDARSSSGETDADLNHACQAAAFAFVLSLICQERSGPEKEQQYLLENAESLASKLEERPYVLSTLMRTLRRIPIEATIRQALPERLTMALGSVPQSIDLLLKSLQ